MTKTTTLAKTTHTTAMMTSAASSTTNKKTTRGYTNPSYIGTGGHENHELVSVRQESFDHGVFNETVLISNSSNSVNERRHLPQDVAISLSPTLTDADAKCCCLHTMNIPPERFIKLKKIGQMLKPIFVLIGLVVVLLVVFRIDLFMQKVGNSIE